MSEMDRNIEYGRILIEIGTAFLQGRIQVTDGQPLPTLPARPNGGLQNEAAHLSNDHGSGMQFLGTEAVAVVPPSLARPGARGQWTARKGYHVVKGWKKVGADGITPAGMRLLEYLEKKPKQSAAGIAGDLGYARKTVENLLSVLRHRHLIEAADLE